MDRFLRIQSLRPGSTRMASPWSLRPALVASVVRRLLHPFVLVVSAILLVGYVYIAHSIDVDGAGPSGAGAAFIMVWILPVVYWFGDRDRRAGA